MAILIIILYLVVGFASTFGYKYLSMLWGIYYGDESETIISLLTGVFWPFVAPFSFAIIFAKHCAKRAEK